MMKGQPLRLVTEEGALPVAEHKPILCPVHWEETAFEEIQRDIKLGVIEKVPEGEPV